jgi:hypothetical protein
MGCCTDDDDDDSSVALDGLTVLSTSNYCNRHISGLKKTESIQTLSSSV